MPKRSLSREELEEHLSEQLGFLERSAEAYDRGFDAEAKRLALTIRILVHHKGQSKALLHQLGLLEQPFISTAMPQEPGNLVSHGGLVMVAAKGRETKYVAMLDDVPFRREIPFDEWWAEAVFAAPSGEALSRRDLVLTAADQDGGAHVDPSIEEAYAKFAKDNAMGWVYEDGSGATAIPLAEKAALRQVAHEVLCTLKSGYSKMHDHKADMFFGGGGVQEVAPPRPVSAEAKVGRNEPCPCGSGRKYKKCHGSGKGSHGT